MNWLPVSTLPLTGRRRVAEPQADWCAVRAVLTRPHAPVSLLGGQASAMDPATMTALEALLVVSILGAAVAEDERDKTKRARARKARKLRSEVKWGRGAKVTGRQPNKTPPFPRPLPPPPPPPPPRPPAARCRCPRTLQGLS